ncbi:uncharacterized protein LOC124457416 isoform X2 [Xenia sp. Carnegie-2017]|uniref:uncharacterized protein LOC124457416 isoform X2 n=1 Tax=Xenia sp. Carnegie-2017 TaxID=2897299 RepID=UPI001F03D655|nr:uncharacterized protein LOC124457416 isoform X2 [Xenia sp. Carnegie-2017]
MFIFLLLNMFPILSACFFLIMTPTSLVAVEKEHGPHEMTKLRLLKSETCPLTNDVVFETTYPSPLSCSMKCLQDPFCSGMNVQDEKKIGDINCQLTYKRPEHNENCKDKTWKFYKILHPQRKIPCQNFGNSVFDLRVGPGVNPYKCKCQPGFTGEFCESGSFPVSCKEAMKDTSLKDGTYLIKTNTSECYSKVFCQRKISGCSGEGWTLVMKIDGKKETFQYNSSLWSNKKSYMIENGETGLDDLETKLPTYWSTKIKMCVGMKVNSTIKFISFEMQAESLYDLIADGKYRKTDLSRSQWLTLVKNSFLQQYCDKEGFNVVGEDSNAARVKLGILGNNENDCISTNSFVGFGGSYGCKICGVISCGNFYAWNDDKQVRAMGYIFIA